jgi:adenine-specific DNA-methyltransferase
VKLFSNDNHKIYFGDCLEILEKEIPDNSVDLIFADPPYNIGKNFNGRVDRIKDIAYLEWSYKWLSLCIKNLSGMVVFM